MVSRRKSGVVGAVVGAGLALGSIAAHAEDARVLPAGRSRFSFTYAKTEGIQQIYNNNGDVEDLTKPYNIPLDSQAISSFASSVGSEFQNLVSLLNDTGLRYDASMSGSASGPITATDDSKPLLGDALTKGFLGVDVEAHRTVSAFTYMTGVTDRLSVGFMIPIVSTRVRASASIGKVNNTIADYKEAFSGMGAGFEPIVSGLETLENANIETLQEQALEKNGYARFGSTEQSGLGDVSFGARYNYFKTRRESWINSVQSMISAPTGKTRNASVLTQVDNGTGNWNAELAHVSNFIPGGGANPWMFSHGLHYVHRLPGKRLMRVRESPSDFLPNASSEEEVRTSYADKVWTTLGAKYTLNSTLSFFGDYEWYYHGRDEYSGSRAKDYTYLGDATELYLETLYLGMSISMIQGFMQKQFPLPMDFSVTYSTTMKGKNTPVTSYVAAEASMYF